jgi:hypothetical protein
MLAALLAVAAAGAFYLRQPSAFWASLLGDAGGLLLPESPAIAVLPFDDMSATGDQQYLAHHAVRRRRTRITYLSTSSFVL